LLAEKFDESANALVLNGVKDELVAAALLHDPCKPQHPELLGNVGKLAFVHDLHDVVDAELASAE